MSFRNRIIGIAASSSTGAIAASEVYGDLIEKCDPWSFPSKAQDRDNQSTPDDELNLYCGIYIA
jgi:hypothetical protein